MKSRKPSSTVLDHHIETLPIDLDEQQQVLAAALTDLSMALNSSLMPDEVLNKILENLSKVVAFKTANIMLIEGNKTKMVRSRGYDLLGTEEMMMARTFCIDEISRFQQMIKSRQPILSYYPHLEQDWNQLSESEWIKSHIAAPIISQDEVIGFLNCDSDIAGFFSKSHSKAMMIFASQAGVAIRNARLFDAATRLGNKLQMINDLTRQVLQATSVDEILHLLPEALRELLDGKNVYISRWDAQTQTVSGWAATGQKSIDYVEGKSQPGEHTLTGAILNKHQPAVINDVSTTKLMEAKYHALYQEKTLFCMPLTYDGEKLGAIMVGYAHAEQITEEIRSLGEYAALQISTAIAKIHSLELERIQSSDLAHANALIESLSKVAAAIKSGADTRTVMSTIGSELEILKVHSVVALKIPESENLTLAYSSVQPRIMKFIKSSGIRFSEYILPIDSLPNLRDVIDNQQAEYIEDPHKPLKQILPASIKQVFPVFAESILISETTKLILIPLVVEQKSIGILGMWGEDLQKIDIQAATIFGGQVAIAIENANLLQEVQRLAITDELTSVLNRRGFDEVANREFGAAKRYSRPLSLIMLDIDRFKAINDVYGHPIGDEILVEIAARARTKIRETDFISRYGGEEFLILLIEQKPENARTVAERIRKSVSDQPFNTSVGKISVTISVGVTGASSQISSINMMIKTVDKALYKSKENGRNRVTMIEKI